jgi:hypothetical protein
MTGTVLQVRGVPILPWKSIHRRILVNFVCLY